MSFQKAYISSDFHLWLRTGIYPYCNTNRHKFEVHVSVDQLKCSGQRSNRRTWEWTNEFPDSLTISRMLGLHGLAFLTIRQRLRLFPIASVFISFLRFSISTITCIHFLGSCSAALEIFSSHRTWHPKRPICYYPMKQLRSVISPLPRRTLPEVVGCMAFLISHPTLFVLTLSILWPCVSFLKALVENVISTLKHRWKISYFFAGATKNLYANKSEHKPKHYPSPWVWVWMIGNPRLTYAISGRWQREQRDSSAVKAPMVPIEAMSLFTLKIGVRYEHSMIRTTWKRRTPLLMRSGGTENRPSV